MDIREETKVRKGPDGDITTKRITYSELKRVIASIKTEITSIKTRLNKLEGKNE